jgi:Domain of unknown function (DUF4136)
MLRRRFVATTLVALFAGTAALANDVSYDIDRAATFGKFRTYAWTVGTPIGDPINDTRITDAVERTLGLKGLTRAANTAPDLTIAYHVLFDHDVRIIASGPGWPGHGFGTARASTVVVGRLGVEIRDAASNRVVWRGYTSVDIDAKASSDQRERKIGKTVSRLLASVPPSGR